MNKQWNDKEPAHVLHIPAKRIRSAVIARHVQQAHYSGVVIFTCGNAYRELDSALRGTGISILQIGGKGKLAPQQWMTAAEIHEAFPNRFDATSGHLSMPLMAELAREFHSFLFNDFFFHQNVATPGDTNPQQFYVPTGSGETIMALHMAYPNDRFCAVYDMNNPATCRDEHNPLNRVVDKLFPVKILPDDEIPNYERL